MTQPTIEELQLLELIHQLTPEEKDEMLNYISNQVAPKSKTNANININMARPETSYTASKDG